MDRVKGTLVVVDQERQQQPVPFWIWPTSWAGSLPADGIGQALTALKAGAALMDLVTLGGIRELQATTITGYSSPTVGSGSYTRSTDKVVAVMLTSQGHERLLEVCCAPKDELFEDDGETVNNSNVDWQAVITAIVDAGLCDTAGNQYTACLRGYRTSRGAKDRKPGSR